MFSMFLANATNRLKWYEMGPEGFFRTNPDPADILGNTDLDFENFYFLDFLDPKFPDFQVPDFQKSGLGQAWALGRAPGRVGPSGGPGGTVPVLPKN